MKKQFTLLALSCAVAVTANAQITINQASFSSWTPNKDTLKDVGATLTAPAANATYDFSGSTYAGNYVMWYRPGGYVSMPATTYHSLEDINVTTGIALHASFYRGNTATGLQTLGFGIDRHAFSIFTATGGANDSLVFDAQMNAYTSPENNLAFPATYNSNWGSSFTSNTSFKVSVAIASISNAPGSIKTMITGADTVKGWGKMKLKNMSGAATGFMDVLVVKAMRQQQDSFFLLGAPMDPTYVAAMNLDQGGITKRYFMRYYRAGEVTPLLEAEYTDANYTSLSTERAHMNRLKADNVGVGSVSNSSEINVYPNPVTTNAININLGDAGKHTYTYNLTDITGKIISSGALMPTANQASISKNVVTASGMYNLTILKDGQIASTELLMIQL